MLYTLVSWIWIGVSCLLIGYFALSMLNRLTGAGIRSIDLSIMYGLCFLTVFAQFFSLFYKVGILANIVLLFGDILVLFFYKKQIGDMIKKVLQKEYKVNKYIMYLIALGIFLVTLALASASIRHYDTDLYHAQSIRWIEEYGVAYGIGNLHNRLAYNSSLFCLQALFSMKYLFGQSMHSVNGFIIAFFWVHAVLSMRVFREGKLYVSDFFRIGMIFFCNMENTFENVSSSGSDLFAIGLFIYLIEKVVELLEDDCKEIAPYAYLCILAVFAVSVKLSVAMIVLITLIPICLIIKNGKWKDMLIYLTAGFIVILPFLIRNVIISGYLIYPYPAIDLFNVDWKMPEYTLLFDSNEIKTWGQGLKDVYLFNTPIKEWFPIWYEGLTKERATLFCINVICLLVSFIWGGYQIVRKKYKELCILVVIVANLVLWFLGAPLPRYGMPFMLLLPLGILGVILCNIKTVKLERIIVGGILLISIIGSYPGTKYAVDGVIDNKMPKIVSRDYEVIDCEEHVLENQIIYTQKEGDRTGYHFFPAAPYGKRFDLIELRGDSLEDGFRMKKEYRNAYVSTYGDVMNENMFQQKIN